MSDLAISFPASAPAYSAAQLPEKQAKKSAPKTDVIDMSKPPTPEQAENMRSHGILGYGTVSASKSVTAVSRSDGVHVTHFTVNYQSEYFDSVNRTVVRTASSGIGVFTSNSSAFAGVTAQVTFSADHYWPGQLEDTADRLAAAHQAKVSYLNRNFSGGELEGRLSHLDDAYQTAKDMAAGSFAGLLGRFLGQEDRGSFEPEIRRGVYEVFDRYEAKYSAIAARQEDGSWLGATLYESAAELKMRTLGQYTPPKQNADGSWDLARWDSVAVTVSAYQSILSAACSDGGAQLLAKFSQVSMKAEAVTIGGRDSGAAELFRVSTRNARLELLAAIGETPSRRQEAGGFNVLA